MAAFLPIQNQIQPINETNTAAPVIYIDNTCKVTADTENEGEPEPRNPGEEIATLAETVDAIETLFKDDKNITIKLTKYAHGKMIALMGSKYDGRLLPDDIVSEAVARILDEKRKWNKQKVSSIKYLIMMVIVSLIRIEVDKTGNTENQLYKSYEDSTQKKSKKKRTDKPRFISLQAYDKYGEASPNMICDIEDFKLKGRDQIEKSFDFEENYNPDDFDESKKINLLEKELEEDETEFFVFQEILAGNKSHINIAEKLGVTVVEVRNAVKRIKRKAKKIKA